jgi:RNA polymerase sigma-70 factor (ECF subfamily)
MHLSGKKIKHDSKEFKTFFKKYFISLCIFSDKIINNDIAAKDIVQDAFLNVWKSENEFENENAFKSYLYVVTKNLSINYLRKNKKFENNKLTNVDIVDDNSIINEIIREETYRMLSEAIKKLGTQSQKIIIMLLKGMNVKEISEELDISVNTVKTLKSRSVKTLKNILGNQFIIILFIEFYRFS